MAPDVMVWFECRIQIFAPDWVRGRDVHVKVREKWIRVSIHEPQVKCLRLI